MEIINLFQSGNLLIMSILTLELASLLLAAWKAPGWLINIGWISFFTGIIGSVVGYSQMLEAFKKAGDISPILIINDMSSILTPFIYGSIIVILSYSINMLQKPRI